MGVLLASCTKLGPKYCNKKHVNDTEHFGLLICRGHQQQVSGKYESTGSRCQAVNQRRDMQVIKAYQMLTK